MPMGQAEERTLAVGAGAPAPMVSQQKGTDQDKPAKSTDVREATDETSPTQGLREARVRQDAHEDHDGGDYERAKKTQRASQEERPIAPQARSSTDAQRTLRDAGGSPLVAGVRRFWESLRGERVERAKCAIIYGFATDGKDELPTVKRAATAGRTVRSNCRRWTSAA